LAISLAVAAKKQLEDEFRPLKMVCAPDPIVEAAARRIVEQWKRVGIEVELITEPPADEAAEWDIIYRVARMAEPLVELWPFLTIEDRARVESLTHLPDWLRQELIELDHATDWNSAVARLRRLHQLLWAEVELVPLWELDEFLVIRKTVQGFPSRPVHPYHKAEQWTVQPWYPTEQPGEPVNR
jgi:ABC-type transport system substrate-binding protein